MIKLEGWNANYVNDSNDDFNVLLEILHNDDDVAFVYQSDSGLKLKYYANENDTVIPVSWLLELLSDAVKKLSNTK